MAFITILKKYYFRTIIKNLTKCIILSTFALRNYGKFVNHVLEKLYPRFLALASTVPVFGIERICSRKVGPWLWPPVFFQSLALNVVFSIPPLPFNWWTSSRELWIPIFFSLWFDPTGNWNRIYATRNISTRFLIDWILCSIEEARLGGMASLHQSKRSENFNDILIGRKSDTTT